MYFTDTVRQVILAFDYDPETGEIANRRAFVQVPEREGHPDGLAVDSEGFVWSAFWDGWKVVRFDPMGKVEREVRLPAARVSCCTFGGANLDELYITTARVGLPEADLRRQPMAGDLFCLRTDVRGQIETKFKG